MTLVTGMPGDSLMHGLIQQATELGGRRVSKLRRQLLVAGEGDGMRLRGGVSDVT